MSLLCRDCCLSHEPKDLHALSFCFLTLVCHARNEFFSLSTTTRGWPISGSRSWPSPAFPCSRSTLTTSTHSRELRTRDCLSVVVLAGGEIARADRVVYNTETYDWVCALSCRPCLQLQATALVTCVMVKEKEKMSMACHQTGQRKVRRHRGGAAVVGNFTAVFSRGERCGFSRHPCANVSPRLKRHTQEDEAALYMTCMQGTKFAAHRKCCCRAVSNTVRSS